MADLQELSFRINGQVSDASNIKSLTKNLQDLRSAVGGNLPKDLERISTALSSINQLKDLSQVKISPNLAKQLSALQNSLATFSKDDVSKVTQLSKALSRLGSLNLKANGFNAIANLNKSLKDLDTSSITKLGELRDALSKFEGIGLIGKSKGGSGGETPAETNDAFTWGSVRESGGAVEWLKGKLDELGTKAVSTGQKIMSLLNPINLLGRGLRGAWSGTKTMFGGLFSGMSAPLTSFASKIKGLSTSLGGLFSQISRIATRMLLRQLISTLTKGLTEGTKRAYDYSKAYGVDFASSMDRLTASSLYLSNSLGALAMPIINALTPAIEFAINKFVDLLNIINQVLSALGGGGTYTQAQYVSKGFDSIGNSAGGASGKAKELKKTLLGFDEINKLNDQSNSGGGGGSGGGGSGYQDGMFSQTTISSEIMDFANKLRDAFTNARWEELGELIGGKLNDIVNMINWKGLGEKVGSAFSGIFSTLDSALTTFDFENLGNNLGDMVNKAFGKMLQVVNDGKYSGFYHLGHLISTWFLALPETIIGFIETLDFAGVAQGLSDAIVGYINGFTDFLKGIDWNNLGHKVVQGIVDFFANAKYVEIAQSIGTFLGTAVGSAVNFIGGAISEFGSSVITKINEYFKGKIDECGGNVVEGFFKGIGDAILGIGSWIKTNMIDPFLKAVKDTLGIHSPSTVMQEIGGYVMEGFLNGIKNFFSDPIGWVKSHIVDPIKSALTNNPISGAVEATVSLGKKGWDTVTSWIKSTTNFGSGLIEKGVNLVKNKWTSVKEWITGSSGNMGTNVQKAVDVIKGNLAGKTVGGYINEHWLGDNAVTKPVSLTRQGGNFENQYVGQWIENMGFMGKDPVKKSVSLKRDGNFLGKNVTQVINTTSGWLGGNVAKGVSLTRSGNFSNQSVAGAITSNSTWWGGNPAKGIALKKDSWYNVYDWIHRYSWGDSVKKPVGLTKTWSTVYDWVCGFLGLRTVSVNVALWGTKKSNDLYSDGVTLPVTYADEGMVVDAIGINRSVSNTLRNTVDVSDIYGQQNTNTMLLYGSIEQQNQLLREQNELLRDISDKEFTADVTSNSVMRAMTRTNKRVGKTVVAIE